LCCSETPSQNLAAKAVIDLQQPNTGLLTQLMLSNESRKELLAIFCAIDQNPRDGIISYSDLQNYTQGLTVWKVKTKQNNSFFVVVASKKIVFPNFL
jgi:hypothetical protein